jgi:RNA polymerase sigma-B factor
MIDTAPCIQLWLRYRQAEYRDRVIEAHRYLCPRAARKFVRGGIDRADLEQIAAIGLIKAVDRYDAMQTTPFEAYAWQLVVGELMHHVRDHERLLRAPRRVREMERRWVSAERELWGLLGHEPSEREVAGYVNATDTQRREVHEYRASDSVVSLDGLRTAQARATDDALEVVLDRVTIQRLVMRLSPLERKILHGLYMEGIALADLANRLGYSRRHVTRLHRAALKRLASLARPAIADESRV